MLTKSSIEGLTDRKFYYTAIMEYVTGDYVTVRESGEY
jgi:hypothetical protein